ANYLVNSAKATAVPRSGRSAERRSALARGADRGRWTGFRAARSAAGLPAACSGAPARAATGSAAADRGRALGLSRASRHLAGWCGSTVARSTIGYCPKFRAHQERFGRGLRFPMGSRTRARRDGAGAQREGDQVRASGRAVERLKRRLRAHPQLEAPPQTSEVSSVYFDTRRQRLRRKGFSLRVRNRDGQRIQTVKYAGTGSAGLSARAEWEQTIHGTSPDWKAVKGTALAPLAKKKLRAGTKALFATNVQRTSYRLRDHGGSLTLVVDEGSIDAGD